MSEETRDEENILNLINRDSFKIEELEREVRLLKMNSEYLQKTLKTFGFVRRQNL